MSGKPLGSTPAAQGRRYVSNGQVLSSPPLSVRFNGAIDTLILFFSLYFVTLLSLDPYSSGLTSAYNVNNRERDGSRTGRGFFGSNRGGSGGGHGGNGGPGSGPGGGGSGGRKLGRVDDIRGPECKSCQ